MEAESLKGMELMRHFRISLLLVAASTMISCSNGFSQTASPPDVTITYERNNRTTVEASGAPPTTKESRDDNAQAVSGTEQSQCRPSDYGRRSGATTSTSTNISASEPTHLTAVLRASALANGGHYRTCVAGCDPFAQNCIGIVGHDTRANASASSSVQAKLTFSSKIVRDFYDVKISSSLPNDMKVKITGPDGSTITPTAGVARITVKPGDIFYVDASIEVLVSNEGGCCNDTKTLAGQFDLQVEKPPILASHKGIQPYIVGGNQTSSYNYVVAILLKGELHCTGTVIADQTILTAAHCINGYESRISQGDMTYLVGSVVTAPKMGPFPISGGIYPRGFDAIQYNPETNDHDIGLLYTSAKIPTPAAAIHHASSSPLWNDIINRQALIFVGFGYNKTDAGDLVGAGVKREAPWQANKADDWRFYFHSAGNNTCSGDSGGPAFFQNEQNRSLVVVGITSVGDPDCTFGADTRMDAHYEWASTRLR
jgi:secreted trypsin-like serine protease